MPELKNTFLEGKMNKDLDARLLKNGEYVDAQNIYVTKSEGSNVGTAQNILGNKLAYINNAPVTFKTRFNSDGGTNINLNAYYQEKYGLSAPNVPSDAFDDISVGDVITGLTSPSGTVTVASIPGLNGSDFRITTNVSNAVYSSSADITFTPASGSGHPENAGTVIGYFADGERTQDDKYKIFYFVKGTGSVKDNIYYYEAGSTTAPISLINNTDNFLNFNTNYLITGINLIDDLLFWTDDLNQPRRINVETAKATTTYYNNEDKISVAKYYPYSAPKVLRQVDGTDHSGMQLLKTQAILAGAVNNSKTLIIDEERGATGADISHDVHVGQEIYDDATFLGKVTAVDNLTITSDTNITKLDNTLLTFLNQDDELKEKFVRFAYRFKFKDSEYSLISPFTQHCFIPKTYNISYDGHELADADKIPGLNSTQRIEAAETTELRSFTNDASHVNLQIEFPSQSPTSDFEIEKIEILIKESDRPSIRSLAQLAITDSSVGSDKIYNYTYKGTLPYKTLPENQLTRVYDNVPAKAKAQEIVGNRLIYGNFHENPNNKPYKDGYSFDYHIGLAQKDGDGADEKFDIQYPYHTIKTRRTYQVGIVLADKYGRQSPVFLSDDVDKSLLKVAAKDSDDLGRFWKGEALEITFNKKIPEIDKDGVNVLYNAITNPTGWYSYKVVVKQTEQDYYNVYAPNAIDDIPNAVTKLGSASLTFGNADKRSWLVLHGDNVNKVPRDTTAISVDENSIFPTLVNLYPKVLSVGTTANPILSKSPLVDIISIGKAMDHGLELVQSNGSGGYNLTGHTYLQFHNYSKNPLLAEMPDGYGKSVATITLNDQSPLNTILPIGFSVWETEPFESALDIYYETVTCGLISTLNTEIGSEGAAAAVPDSICFDNPSNGTTAAFPENMSSGSPVTATGGSGGGLKTKDSSGSVIANSGLTYTITEVLDNNSQPPLQTVAETHFKIEDAVLKTSNAKFYYGDSNSGGVGHEYLITIKVVQTSSNATHSQVFTITLTNSAPAVVLPATANHAHFLSNGVIFSPTSTSNGSSDPDQDELNITYSITSVLYDPATNGGTEQQSLGKFIVNSSTGAVSANNHVFPASEVGKVYRVFVQSNDNSGQSNNVSTPVDSCDVTIGGLSLGEKIYSVNFPGLCTAVGSGSPTQVYYLKRPATNTSVSTAIEEGDLIYTDSTLQTAVGHAYIITTRNGGEEGTGYHAEVTSGVVDTVGQDNPPAC